NIGVALSFNIVTGLGVIYCSYRIAEEIWGSRRYALLTALVVSGFPTLVTYAITPARDTLIILCICIGIIQFLKWLRRNRLRYILLLVGSMGIGAIMHTAVTFMLLSILGIVALRLRQYAASGSPTRIGGAISIGIVVICAG